MHRPSLAVLALATNAGAAAAQSPPNGYPVKPVPFADSAEIAIALSAAPSEVSAHATVYAVRDGRIKGVRVFEIAFQKL